MNVDDVFCAYMEGQLKDVLPDIEMPASYYEKARTSYGSLKAHLEGGGSAVSSYDPEVFLQGSIRTGTAIKPVTDDGSYDVDVVCNIRALSKGDVTQEGLKDLVGTDVKSYARAHSMSKSPHEGKRCWTLEYVDDANFHMDVLPTVDDSDACMAAIQAKGLEVPALARFMAHTDRRSPSFSSISPDWPSTNPLGYAKWFFDVAGYESRRLQVASARASSPDEVTPDQVKTPLQQYVQLLKRHRDIFFDSRRGLVPIRSIVVTTLAARAYESIPVKAGWYPDFVAVAEKMPMFIERLDDGSYRLPNPSNPIENFAEGWGEAEMASLRQWHAAVSKEIAPSRGSLKKGLFNRIPRRELRRALGVPEHGGKLAKRASGDAEYVSGLSHHRHHGLTEIDAVAVSVTATKSRSGGMPKPFRSGDELPKRASLQFEAHAKGIKNFRVRWQVTNDGREALRANCLRGDFYETKVLTDGRKTRHESTAYTGRHYVECILERDGVVYGRSEPFVVNIVDGASANLNW